MFLQQEKIRKSSHVDRHKLHGSLVDSLMKSLSDNLSYAVCLAQEKGASSWLCTLPIREYGYALHKGAFRDALALHCGWTPIGIPSECICGKNFTVEHALSCTRGGFLTLHHNHIRDITASLLSEVSMNVVLEPELQPQWSSFELFC